MDPQTSLLAEIEEYLRTRKMAETTFGLRAVNDGKLVGRLKAGKDMKVSTVRRIRDFMARCPENADAA